MIRLLLKKENDQIEVKTDGSVPGIATMISDVMMQSEEFAITIESAFKNYLAHGGKEEITERDLEIAKMEVKNNTLLN